MSTPKPVRAYILAMAFAAKLHEWLSPEEMAEVVARNAASTDPLVCASHDFCDANMAMAEAFEATQGREILFPSDVESGACTQEQSDADLALFNSAWDLAKAAGFDAEQIESRADESILDAATHAALDEACRMIQDHLGVTTGDFAGMYFSGNAFDSVKATLRSYLEAERASASAD
ncbi:hypothetical protein [Methylibium petroleiphilum]|uniref:Uncharacterized protein n=1 Tax=Methylibium petroleiphilum (strain ATCC BAA-1232 / LMG 22953 / PM1) TaxID=420662 RepID=A2SNH5_METPP|nr:hypothetical protein [Methylibium petroleiphilum]ABM97114.1 hypothetical protein Mpe_B0339 [Methylibium petroleiphilum PM1]